MRHWANEIEHGQRNAQKCPKCKVSCSPWRAGSGFNPLKYVFEVNTCSCCSALEIELVFDVQFLDDDPLEKTGQMFDLVVLALILQTLCMYQKRSGNRKRAL